jgi:hypothetical protein
MPVLVLRHMGQPGRAVDLDAQQVEVGGFG